MGVGVGGVGEWFWCTNKNWQSESSLLQMKNIWATSNLTINIKIRIFRTTIEFVLLYGVETWRTTAVTLKKIHRSSTSALEESFESDGLRPSAIENSGNELSNNQQKMKSPKDVGDGLDTSPESQWPLSHIKPWPGTHRERESEAAQETPGAATETKRTCYSWGRLERLAQDRDAWRAFVGGLCSCLGQRQWWWALTGSVSYSTLWFSKLKTEY